MTIKVKAADPSLLKGLGKMQLDILQAVSRLENEDRAYGLRIAEELVRQTGRFVNPAQVFITLKRLVVRRLIVQEGVRIEEGLPKMKLYQVTDLGVETLRAYRAGDLPADMHLREPRKDGLTGRRRPQSGGTKAET